MMKDSVIDGELRSRLTKLRRAEDGEYSGEIVFDAGFRGFEGHFEGNPIVPGVCLIELVRVHAESALGKVLEVSAIRNCRFRRPVLAGDRVTSRLKIDADADGPYQLGGTLVVGEAVACQVKLTAVSK